MAQEHTLKLKAILDTSDVQAKLNRLNSQQSQAQQAGPSQGTPGGIAQGINNVLLRLNNSITQLNNSIVRMNQGIARMASVNANAGRIQPQTPYQNSTIVPYGGGSILQEARIKNMADYGEVGAVTGRVVENEVRKFVKIALRDRNEMGWSSQIGSGVLGIFGGTSGVPAQNAVFQKIFGGMKWSELNDPKYRKYVDEFLNPPDPTKNQKFNPLYMQSMRMMLGGQVLGQFASLGQQHAEMTGHTGIAAGFRIMQNMATTAAFGAALGPAGALGGAAVGAGLSLYEGYVNKRKWELQEEERKRLEKEQAVFDKIDAAGVKRKYTSAREAFGMDRSIYAAAKNADISSLEQIRQSLVIKQQNAEAGLRVLDRQQTIDPTVAADLQTTLASTLSKIQAIDQTIEAIKKHKEEEARLSERINKGISDSRLAMSRFDESRLNGRFFSENVDDYRQNAELYGSNARASKAEYLRLLGLAENETDNEKKQKILQEAADAKSSWQFNLGQSDSFQQGYISKLQELLSRLVAPDMSPVTSLAAIGRDAGSSDNTHRQFQFWNESLTLQREIRDAIGKGVATYD